jgi:hypothetical protein
LFFIVIYRTYEAERPKTRAEQREIDRINGEFAAAIAQLSHSFAVPWRAVRRAWHIRRRRAEPAPRPRSAQSIVAPGRALHRTHAAAVRDNAGDRCPADA